MHVFIAGAAGAVGRTLIPTLIADGHTVTGTTRSEARADGLRALGADAVLMDGLDEASVMRAVTAAAPDAIVHQMTALSGDLDFRDLDRTFAATNRLRTEGTEHLLAAAQAAGVRRFVAQSFAGWPYARTGGPVKSEADPLDPDPPRGIRETHAAIRRLEALVTGAGGVALRYGGFYGPGTGLAPGGDQFEMIRKRKFPLIGDGGGIWSFAHTQDVATATVAALERGRDGEIYNVCDDDPAPLREWLPAIARSIGARPPRRVPAWLARRLASPAAVVMMTDARGASNAKAKAELAWTPAWPTWREGFAALEAVPVAA
jgi:nucleoside-diphosphate-sugar epimerase